MEGEEEERREGVSWRERERWRKRWRVRWRWRGEGEKEGEVASLHHHQLFLLLLHHSTTTTTYTSFSFLPSSFFSYSPLPLPPHLRRSFFFFSCCCFSFLLFLSFFLFLTPLPLVSRPLLIYRPYLPLTILPLDSNRTRLQITFSLQVPSILPDG